MQLVESDVNGKAGYVYVLTNPSMPGLIKVGHSINGGQGRASALFKGDTGVPTPFELEYEAYLKNCHAVEMEVHRRLAEKRVNEKREFFECEPGRAVTIITEISRNQHHDHDAEYRTYQNESAATVMTAVDRYVLEWEADATRKLWLNSIGHQFLTCGLSGGLVAQAFDSVRHDCSDEVTCQLLGIANEETSQNPGAMPKLEKLING